MWLVLCFPFDAAAHWAAEGLRARGLTPVRVVYPEELAQWSHWEHRIGAGGVSTRVILSDGGVLDDDSVHGVLNRLMSLPPGPLAGPDEQAYVAQELRALYWSWLTGLRAPVVDPPGPHGFAGPGHVSEWLRLAAGAGLQAPVYRLGSDDELPALYGERPLFPQGTPLRTVLVAGDQTLGAETFPSPEIGAACRRLAAAAGTSLLGVDFAAGDAEESDADWVFAGASPMPDLRLGGEPLIEALARQLGPEVAA